jgi:hypothetical protein
MAASARLSFLYFVQPLEARDAVLLGPYRKERLPLGTPIPASILGAAG